MIRSKMLELYGGAAPAASSDQETREEYEARKASKKRKKHKEKEATQPHPKKVLETVLRVVDAEEAPLQGESIDEDRVGDGRDTYRIESDDETTRVNVQRRPRIDSSSSSEEEDAQRSNTGRRRRRRPRVESESDEETKVVSNSERTRPNAEMEIDSDGDVVTRARRRRRTDSSSSSSSDEKSGGPSTTIGLKTKEEFARIMEEKDRNSADKEDEYALGKGQATVYRDKSTGEIKQVPTKSQQEIEKENEILRYELNMGAMDKLILQGINTSKDPEEEILAEDPMARFLRKSRPEDELTLTGKPKYKGRAPAPNRFLISPGYRWDGVDRSNGFESRLLKKRNERLGN